MKEDFEKEIFKLLQIFSKLEIINDTKIIKTDFRPQTHSNRTNIENADKYFNIFTN